MLGRFEEQYFELLSKINNYGESKLGRNGSFRSIHGAQLKFDVSDRLPILTARKIYYKGIAGEYAAFIRGFNHIDDFKKWGCNFWDSWADDQGFIKADYGNAWIDYNESNQMEEALRLLRTDPNSRRILIDAWRPDRLSMLSLPCCHYSYQFCHWNGYVDLIWTQRSADMAVGVPSDAISAAIMLNVFCDLADLNPRYVIMNLGDCHIYEEHRYQVHQMIRNVWYDKPRLINPKFNIKKQKDLYSFVPEDLEIFNYKHYDPIKFKLMV